MKQTAEKPSRSTLPRSSRPPRSGLLLAALLGVLLTPGSGQAQEPPPEAATEPSATEPSQRPGRWQLGPFYLTPRLLVSNVALDTNVFFSNESRHRDLMLSGGPGLELVLPIRRVYLTTFGVVDYIYFAKTKDQRRFTGNAGVRAEWRTPRLTAGVTRSYARTFQRQGFEVDDRVLEGRWSTAVDLRFNAEDARFRVYTRFNADQVTTDPDRRFFGQDLHTTLTRDETIATLGFEYGLTPKTSAVLETGYERHRFDLDSSRNSDVYRLATGLDVRSQTTLSGRALVGLRWTQPRGDAPWAVESPTPYVRVELAGPIFAGTRLRGQYDRDLAYSSFIVQGSPFNRGEKLDLWVDQRLVGRFHLLLHGLRQRLLSDGPIAFTGPDGRTVVAKREDTFREGSANLLYDVKPRLAIGFGVTYRDRDSSIEYFGVSGLRVGIAVVYSGTPTVTVTP